MPEGDEPARGWRRLVVNRFIDLRYTAASLLVVALLASGIHWLGVPWLVAIAAAFIGVIGVGISTFFDDD